MADYGVVVVGAGAAGIAAGRALKEAGASFLIVEARDRIGGRAYTVPGPDGAAIDLGCGWLHSAEENPWSNIAMDAGVAIDRTPPPWMRMAVPKGAPTPKEIAATAALRAFRQHLDGAAKHGIEDPPASHFIPPGEPYAGLLDAVSTFYSGTELRNVSVRDLARFEDTGVNWRVATGYGALIAGHGADLPVRLATPVRRIDHSGPGIRVETDSGTISARAVIVTVATALLAAERIAFSPALPDKASAAAGLPLGLADKLYLALPDAESFTAETRLFGSVERAETAAYHFRPFGRPLVEAYFGGAFAHQLESAGEEAFVDLARTELAARFGADFARRLHPVALHRWATDEWAGGSYSCALPGHADDRAILATPVDERLFFAGEACSVRSYSTAHGAYETGLAAAAGALAAVESRPR
ncbi:MAG: FAD-dependent oxidoreductase [Bauldia sp.]|nr:FAD-dependent oxidoreductase [Bauldia sp.]